MSARSFSLGWVAASGVSGVIGRNRAVAVEVVGRGQHRAAALGGREQGRGQGRPVGEPLVVERVGAVVEGGGAVRPDWRAGRRRVASAADPLDGRVLRPAAAAGDHADLSPRLGEQLRGGGADGPGADDHVQRHH